MSKIPDSFVEDLRRRIEIVDVVSEYVQLRRAGRSFVGLCPFHNERSPSFSVSAERQMFHCFGCGAGGTVIRFVMDIEGLTFVESVVKLAERAGVELPFEIQPEAQDLSVVSRNQRMKDAHELAAKYFNYILMNTAAGVQALKYLDHRGISRHTIVDFNIGYAPDGGDTLTTFLKRRGFETDLLVDAGLAVLMGSQVVDRFRARVMIPIQDSQGSTVAFGGRILTDDGKPKYLNSPETPIFKKGLLLFHHHVARREIRKLHTAILMEGYMDVITAWQNGVKNSVATLGTALTSEQMTLVKRSADRVIVAYDGDNAGQTAAQKALVLAEQVGLDVRIARFPDKTDPDEFLRKYGSQGFDRLIRTGALSGTQFLLQRLRESAELGGAAGRTDFIRQSLEILSERASPIEQDAELRLLSDEFHISMEALKEELQSVAKNTNRRRGTPGIRNDRVPRAERGVQSLPKGSVTAGNRILQAMLTDKTSYQYVMGAEVSELVLPEQTALLARLYAYHIENPEGDIPTFIDSLEDPELVRLASSLLIEEAPSFNSAVLEDYLRTIRLHVVEEQYRVSLEKLVQAQLLDNAEAMNALRMQIDELQHEITQLRMPLAKSK